MSPKNKKFPEGTFFLVTGGAGFIGSNIVETILDMGYRVRVLDNFSEGKKENIKDFLKHKNFELLTGDIRDKDTCQASCKGIDYVLHQAALGSVPRSIHDPISTNDVNITGTLNMLIAARDNKVKKFVFASSSSVYGDDLHLPKVETSIGTPLSPYAISKRVNELYAGNFHELYGLKTVGLRYFNVFGKRQNPDSQYSAVIPVFIKSLIEGIPPKIYGDGMQSRDFTYIDNVVKANLLACLSNGSTSGQVYNIAAGGRTSLIDLYNTISGILGKYIQPEFVPERKGDIRHSNADISNAEKMLGYEPHVGLEEGLKKTVEWYKYFISSGG
jgi:UDP-N-acetylglucosamine/UDP-N-acetylgalactosamine 4-epimerase